MLTLHPRAVAATAGAAAGEPAEPGEGGHDEGRACFCVLAACVSLLLFVVLCAATGSLARACAIAAAATVLLGLAGWVAPSCRDGRRRVPAAAAAASRHQAPAHPAGVRLVVQHHRCPACGMADAAIAALPAFAYEPPAAKDGGDGDGKARSSSALLCAVCLDDVRAGETVRQLPACRHLFHADCVDAWLRAHRTCPLCRCDLSPPSTTAKADAVAAESSPDDLPPV
ncbi:unnamed protein product [Urochloa decumbens]|uniref:RING-type E3 ubiquitin transferase n=1 Tax=Urochloa decumbens TaxID=240449 RepID=A0ABC9E8S4_9POAL